MTAYRAAYTRETPTRREIILTLPEHSTLTDAELIAEAVDYGRHVAGLDDLREDDIEVGDWTE